MATFPQPNPLPQPIPAAVPSETEAPSMAAASDPLLHPRIGFFQQHWVQTALPFATSVILHLSIILVVVVFFKVAPSVFKAVREQIIIPDAAMVSDAPVGGIQNPGLGSDPNRAARQDKLDAADTSGLNDKKTQSLSQSLMGGAPADGAAETVISLGVHAGLHSDGGVGAAMGAGNGSDSNESAVSPFGFPLGGGGLGPKSPFMGISGNARTIAYVCDASGSMLTKMLQLKDQLRQSVAKLQPVQSFSVVFFADPDVRPAAFSQSLVMANPDNKLKFEKYLADIRAAGSTDPVPGLELAFKMHPQLIYLLTDGDFDDNKAVLDKINQLQAQANPKVKINSIVFTDPNRADKGIVELFKKISADSGGVMKIRSPNEFD